MNRRHFLQNSAACALGLLSLGRLAPLKAAVPGAISGLTITKIETVRFRNDLWMWLRLHTNEGIIGTG